MKAFALDDLGQPGSIRELPDPQPGSGEVRIQVAAASLNPFDASVIRGYVKDYMEHRFPLIPGADASGTIDAVGDGVTGFTIGDEVFGVPGKASVGEGSLAQYVTLSAGTIARKPAALDPPTAAAIPIAGVTAKQMIETMAISKGHVIVVLGATGGVGSYLVQLAARAGAHVVAVCSTRNEEYARALGAAEVIDYTKSDVVDTIAKRFPHGIDGVADLVGDKDVITGIAGAIKEGGHFSSAVRSADEEALSARGISGANVQGNVTTAELSAIAGLLERKEIRAPELRTVPLTEAASALDAVGSGHVRGKIVVIP